MKQLLSIGWVLLALSLTAQRKIHPDSLSGLPQVHDTDQIIRHTGFTLCYAEPHEQASWVAYDLSPAKLIRAASRTNRFLPDPFVRTGSAIDEDYRGSGYDRGHLAPAADMAWSVETMTESFYFSNMSPQAPSFNRGIWKNLEEQVRDWAAESRKMFVVTGPLLEDGLGTIGPNRVSVPRAYYKALLFIDSQHRARAIGFVLPNEASSDPLSHFAISVDSLERLSGIDFFPELRDATERSLESNLCIPCWDWEKARPGSGGSPKNIPQKTEKLKETTAPRPSGQTVAVQCSGTTRSGNRCRNNTKDPSGRCAHHRLQ